MLTATFTFCKKDEDTGPANRANEIIYDGTPYLFNEGTIWDYGPGTFTPNHYSHGYFIPGADVYSRRNNYPLPPNDPPLTLSFFLSTPDSQEFKTGTFQFVEEFTGWGNNDLYEAYLSSIRGKFMLTNGTIGFDTNGDGLIDETELFRVTEGNIKVSQQLLEFNLTLSNGKKVTGRTSLNFNKTFPPA